MFCFWMLIQERLDLNPEQQKLLPSELVRRERRPYMPPQELLDAFTELISYNQAEPNDLENYEDESSFPSLIIINSDRQGHDVEIQKELKGLKKLVTSLSWRPETLWIQDTYQKSNSLPTIIASLDLPTVPKALKARQTPNISNEFPLQACDLKFLSYRFFHLFWLELF